MESKQQVSSCINAPDYSNVFMHDPTLFARQKPHHMRLLPILVTASRVLAPRVIEGIGGIKGVGVVKI